MGMGNACGENRWITTAEIVCIEDALDADPALLTANLQALAVNANQTSFISPIMASCMPTSVFGILLSTTEMQELPSEILDCDTAETPSLSVPTASDETP
jgi:hypothetical protein